MANNPQSSGLQPIAPTQQGQPFIPVASQQHQPVGHGLTSSNIGMPPVQGQPHQYSQQMQQQPAWLGHPGHALPTSQAVPMQYAQASRPLQPGSSLPQQSAQPYAQFFPPYGQPQNNASVLPQFQPIPQMRAPATPAGGQPWLASGSHSAVPVPPVQTTAQQPSSSYSDQGATSLNAQSSSDWQEHTAADGRRYYYNKKTKQSSWEKPFELMTPIERADASTVWKEFTTPEGKKYYYNKVTKQSKWTIPEELKLAREQAQRAAADSAQSIDIASPATTVTISAGETSSAMASSNADSMSTQPEVTPSSLAVTPVAGVAASASAIPVGHSTVGSDVSSVANAATFPTVVGSNAVPAPIVNNQKKLGLDNQDHISQGVARSADGTFLLDSEEGKNDVAAVANVNATPSEERASDDEPLVFANKQEAKNAFKALLESAGVRSDWSWEQAMREIIDDKRYAALKTPGERKQAFNEYLGQRKKIEAEERRIRQKKAREEFMKMLEESKELTSSMKWSKAVSMFENDERFKAVERARDREDLFDNYIVELERKERELAAEEHRRNVEEYRKFLESCDYIKVNSQWRKIQDRLEDDERCSRLEKLDRLLIYQDYIRDLERAEEEQKKLQKEQLRRAERKNRDEFRKLMEEQVAAGVLTAKTHWLDYCLKVKDLPQYHAVATNTSGSKPKDLFEDVFEELENQYHDDRARVKNVMKSGKVNIVSTLTLEDFKAAVFDAIGLPAISDINLKLLYEEQIDRAKEKEEKDAKKRQHLADDLRQLLCTFKEITASSSWEDCKPLFEESEEYRLIEESFAREVFEEYVAGLQEKVKEKERKREEEKAKKEKDREEKEKRKEKDRKEKDKDKERERDRGKERMKKDDTDSENVDGTESQSHKEDRKKERKHRKRHHNANDDVISDKDEKEESKKSRRHGSDRKKSRKHAYSPESDTESHHKKHKRDHRDSSRKHGGKEELEDGELGEDGEIRHYMM